MFFQEMVQEAMEIKRQKLKNGSDSSSEEDEEEEVEAGTMVKVGVPAGDNSTMKFNYNTTDTDATGTMIDHGATLEMGTMVINDDDEDDGMGTMQRFDTGPTPNSGSGGRPAFMNYFDNVDNGNQERGGSHGNSQSKKEGLPPEEAWKFSKNITEMDFDFLKNLTINDLEARHNALDMLMEKEIDDLRKRYHEKRQPILDAIDAKKRRQQNF